MSPRRFDPCFLVPTLVLTLVFVLAVVGGVVTAVAGAELIAGWLGSLATGAAA